MLSNIDNDMNINHTRSNMSMRFKDFLLHGTAVCSQCGRLSIRKPR